jgi:hypothetical protein
MGRDLHAKAQAFMLLFGAVFLAGAGLSAWVAVEEAMVSYPLMKAGARTEGEIFGTDYVRAGGKWKNIPLMRFTPENGQELVVHVVGTSLGRGHYPVLYMRGDPKIARIDRFEAMWLWCAIASVGALLMALPGVALLRKGLRGF